MEDKGNKNLHAEEPGESKQGSNEPKQEEDNYHFIKEVIKDRPADKKKLLQLAGGIAAGAVIFGVIAAFVFAGVRPFAEKFFEKEEKPPQVDILDDGKEQTDDTDEAQQEETSGEDNTDTPPQQEGEAQTEDEPPQTIVQEIKEEFTLQDYKELYGSMLMVADEPKKSIVNVMGINSQVDYFNQTYDSPTGQVSGLLIANNGQDLFILTEYRIVENVERIQVTFCDGTIADGRFQKTDPNTGLAILRVALSDVSPETKDKIIMAPLGSSYAVKQGEPIIAIGMPMGYSNSVAYGVVTSVTNKVAAIDTEYSLLTTDILGSSEGSGILLNLDGEVIGIINQTYSVEGSKNIVTALAISQTKQLIENLSNNVDIIYAGIKGQDVTAEIAASTGIPKGVCVNRVVEDSPAMQVGIMPNDVITAVGDTAIETLKQYHEELIKYQAGDIVKIKVMRLGTEGYVEKEFDVTLSAV